jgi:hypothetical protein
VSAPYQYDGDSPDPLQVYMELNRLRTMIAWMDNHDPQLVASAAEKFGDWFRPIPDCSRNETK